MMPPSITSELNSIEIYTNNDYSFYISDDFDPQATHIYFAPGDSLDYVIRAVKKEDRHLIDSYDEEYLCDVVLSDPCRNIYCTKGTATSPPDLVIKFTNVCIWLTSGEITSIEKANVLYSIIDTVSYWLAEAKKIVESMAFKTDAIRIHIDASNPTDQYYNKLETSEDFTFKIDYIHAANTITMIWNPLSFQLLGKETNATEKTLMESVFNELALHSQTAADLRALDALFANPVKKKVCKINAISTPYMVPTTGDVPCISAEEEQQLLDEIGAHFLSMQEYNYGRVPNEKRAELTNKVVSFLYSLLQNEVASLNCFGLYEKVCYDLETVMYKIMLAHNNYVYDVACYPEKKARIIEKYTEANRASVALKFLAEYIAAIPPTGDNMLGTMQYDRILAICSLIVDWAYKNDLFVYNIFNAPVEFLKSGRIGIARSEIDYLTQINISARTKRMQSLSDPRIPVYKPIEALGDFRRLIDEAFNAEYGFTFQQFTNCIVAIAELGDSIKSDVKRAKREYVVSQVAQTTHYSVECVNAIITLISLGKRDDFLVPPKPYRKEDVYPWRFNRELSFTRRPLILHNDDLIWGNRQLHHMLRYTVDLIMDGRYKARHPKLLQLIGKLSDIRGNEFNSVVYQKIKSIDGIIACERLAKINGKKIVDAKGNTLGDIDIFYIVPEKHIIVVGEVKDFSVAKSPYEMAQEYARIFVDGKKPCYMTKHKRRAAWIQEHLEDVKTHFSLADNIWAVKTVMFVSDEIISNEFYHQNERIIVYSQISEKSIKTV